MKTNPSNVLFRFSKIFSSKKKKKRIPRKTIVVKRYKKTLKITMSVLIKYQKDFKIMLYSYMVKFASRFHLTE